MWIYIQKGTEIPELYTNKTNLNNKIKKIKKIDHNLLLGARIPVRNVSVCTKLNECRQFIIPASYTDISMNYTNSQTIPSLGKVKVVTLTKQQVCFLFCFQKLTSLISFYVTEI